MRLIQWGGWKQGSFWVGNKCLITWGGGEVTVNPDRSNYDDADQEIRAEVAADAREKE